MDTSCFDDAYITGLRDRKPDVETHFVLHFRLPIMLKARRQLRSHDLAEDACQETLLRALNYFRSGKRLDNPASLPAFVHSICHNVTLEMIRSKGRFAQIPEYTPEPVDPRMDTHLKLVSEERQNLVRKVLAELPGREGELLRLAVLEETDREELCRRFQASEDYLRVLLHRARLRFRAALLELQRKVPEKSESGVKRLEA